MERTRKSIASIIMILTVACCTAFGVVCPAQPVAAELVERIVAVVNDDIILLSELEKTLEPIKQKLQEQGYPLYQQSQILADQRTKILEQMILDKLKDQQIKRYGIEIEEQEINNTINRIKEANRFSDEQFRQALAMEGLTYDDYRQEMKEQLLRSKLINYEVRSKIVVTDEDVKTYYDNQKDRYQGKTKYHLRHILIKVDPEAGDLEHTKGLQQARKVYEQLQQGQPFDKVANIYSDAPTAKDGGDLGVFEVSYLTDQARKALADVQVGHFSNIVETEQGYQIYFVEDAISTDGKSFEQARSEIMDKLYAERIDQKYRAWIEELRKRAHVQIME